MADQSGAERLQAQAIQFASYIEMTEALTDRQATVIRYYISLHTAMIAAGGAVFLSAMTASGSGAALYLQLLVFLLAITGSFFCRLWRKTLASLRYWEEIKYRIIRETEQENAHLLQLYAREWDASNSSRKVKARNRVLGLPRVFGVFYAAAASIVLIALVFEMDRQFFASALLNGLDAVLPGVKELFTPGASAG